MHAFLLSLVGIGLLAFPAAAFTQAEIDAAAIVARRIDLVEVIADDRYEGRDNDTTGSAAIQEVLIHELAAVGEGLNAAATGDDAYRQSFHTSQVGTNLLAVIPGSDLGHEYVMVGAHYDHLGQQEGRIANGATDNAAGVAVVLAIGRAFKALPAPPRRSIILALWDAEEDDLAGSRAYVDSPLVPNRDVVAYINFDIQGSNLLPSLRDTSFVIGAESGGSLLEEQTLAAAAFQRLKTRPLSVSFGRDRSDHVNLLAVGVPSVFFTDAPGSCYHSDGDDISVVDLTKLREQSQLAFRLAVAISELDDPPVLRPTSAIAYDDAITILHVLDGAVSDISLFEAHDQPLLSSHRDAVRSIVDDGPAAFDRDDELLLAAVTGDILAWIDRIPCTGFMPAAPPKDTDVTKLLMWAALAILAMIVFWLGEQWSTGTSDPDGTGP